MQGSNKGNAKAAFAAQPWYMKIPQAADDVARLGANGITLGGMDRLSSYMNGTPLEDEQARTWKASERAGAAGIAAKLLGAMAPSRAATLPAVSLTRMVPASAKGRMGMVGRGAALAGDAATLHTIQGITDERPSEPEKDARALIMQALLSRR
jgi:hypothetical protein